MSNFSREKDKNISTQKLFHSLFFKYIKILKHFFLLNQLKNNILDGKATVQVFI